MSATTPQGKRIRKEQRASARPRFLRSATAVAVSLGLADVQANTPPAKFRLALDDEISSRIDTKDRQFDGRLAVEGLIQSHPDALYVQLEERYQALPPFTQAEEAVAERYIEQATTPEKMLASVKTFAGNVSRFVPMISSKVRYDDIDEDLNRVDADGNPLARDDSTALVTINPTFLYEAELRKWHLRARYDYEHGQYYIDEDESINDHRVNVNWTRRLKKGQELSVLGLYEDTHERTTNDPIEDFNSALESNLLDYNRTLLNVTYRNGTLRDRSRYDAYLFGENSSVKSEELAYNGYELDRIGIGGSYAWRVKRQLSLVAEGRYNQLDYDLAFRDNTHYRALVGTDLIIGRRVRAILRVGYAEKSFDDTIHGDTFGEPVWNGHVEWALRRKTSVKLETGREIFELATVDQPIDTSKFNIQDWVRTVWAERWTDNLSTETSYTYRDTSFEGRRNKEQAQQFIVSAVYQAGFNLKFAIDGAYTRQEDDLGEDLSRRTFTFRTEYSL